MIAKFDLKKLQLLLHKLCYVTWYTCRCMALQAYEEEVAKAEEKSDDDDEDSDDADADKDADIDDDKDAGADDDDDDKGQTDKMLAMVVLPHLLLLPLIFIVTCPDGLVTQEQKVQMWWKR